MSLFAEIESRYSIRIVNWLKVRDVYKIETKRHGTCCLKSFDTPVEEVQFIADVETYLIQTGFLYSPRMFFTHEGTPYFKKDGLYYMLTNWIDGHHPRFRTKIELKASIQTLARFHRHAKNIPFVKIPERRFRVFSLEERFKNAYRMIRKEYPAIQGLCEKALIQLGDTGVQKAILREGNAKAFIHGDYNYPNLVVDKSGNHHLIDFDNTSCHVRMEDLAHIIHRNSAWQADGVLRMVEIYDRVRPVSREDFRLLIALMHEPYPLIRAIHQKSRHPNLGVPRVPGQAVLKVYSRQLCEQM